MLCVGSNGKRYLYPIVWSRSIVFQVEKLIHPLEMFGFAHPSIAKLIQEMHGAELCDKYIPQQFVPSSARIRLDEPSKGTKKKNFNKKKFKGREYDSDSDSGPLFPFSLAYLHTNRRI